MTTTDAEFKALGRDDVNSVESILADDSIDFGDVAHSTPVGGDAVFTWDYARTRPGLSKLYERAKTSQWNGDTDLDWSIEVDVDQVARSMALAIAPLRERLTSLPGSPLRSWGDKEWTNMGVEAFRWRMSQFLHGEQGALVCTAKIVETVPWIDAKYYASTQVMDEARHVEVFARYLDTKLSGHYPINAHLQMLLDDIINDSRWDMTYLGMQIMVEGLALAAFGFQQQMTTEPLLKKLLRYVMSDQARHVAFGVLSLQDYYQELSTAELRDRQEFAFEAATRMRDRFLQQEVFDRMGLPVKEVLSLVAQSPERLVFQQMLFSKIVPNLKKLGLLDAGAKPGQSGWLRKRFEELGVIQFEDWADTGEEYDMFQLANGATSAA